MPVDVLATDYLDSAADYNALRVLCGGSKLIAIAETMNPPMAGPSISSNAPWDYWVTWARRDWNSKSAADLTRAMADPLTITLKGQ